MKQNFAPTCLILSLLFFSGLQCIKRQVECTGNCNQMQVTGVAINRLTGEAVPGVPFQLTWSNSHITIDAIIGKYIFKGSSGSNGNISFTTTIDTARFADEGLSVRMIDNDNFVMDNVNTESLFLDAYSPTGFQNIVLGVYPQVKLVLHLTKTQAVTWTNLLVQYQYDDGRSFQAYHTDFPNQFTSQDVTVPTAAGVATIITISKGKADGTFDESTDSITCKQNTSNEKIISL